MAEEKPELVIVAGPNGAGKTTFITTYLPEFTNIREFVNADMIAKGISPFDPDAGMIEAGRIEIARIQQFSEERKSFAVESTLSGKSATEWIADARTYGFFVKLFYIYISSSELSIERIAARVRAGGHNIPDDVARRRYTRSLKNLFHDYIPLFEEVEIYDNSQKKFLKIAKFQNGNWIVSNSVLFDHVRNLL